jgi:hypothetical protein
MSKNLPRISHHENEFPSRKIDALRCQPINRAGRMHFCGIKKNNISEEKTLFLCVEKALSSLGYQQPTKTTNKAAFHSLLEGN